MTTKVVTTFDSDSPPPRGDQEELSDKFEFAQVFEALRHSREVAENVFARCAKKLFRGRLASSVRIKLAMPDEETKFPIWVTSAQITVAVRGAYDEPMWASYLENLVEESAVGILRLRDENETVRLIGPLSTRIQEVGVPVYTFSIKQKWAVDV